MQIVRFAYSPAEFSLARGYTDLRDVNVALGRNDAGKRSRLRLLSRGLSFEVRRSKTNCRTVVIGGAVARGVL